MIETWKKDVIVYQIYPRSFKDSSGDGVGDIRGIIEKIPYLKDLGINAVWLSPIYASPMHDNGYDISDYQAIHPDYGTMDDFKALVKALHAAKIKLIMDLVINHTSYEHPWFLKSKSGKNSDYRDFYIWRKGRKNNQKPPNNWTSFFTGKAWTYVPERKAYYLHLFSPEQPDLNWDNPRVVKALKSVINYWIDRGVDGFRLDVINLISKKPGLPNGRRRIALTGKEHYLNGPRVPEHLQKLNKAIFAPRNVMTVGETVFVTPEEAKRYVADDKLALDMVFHFEHMFIDNWNKWFLLKFKMRKLKKVLDKWQNAMYPRGWNALYFENHDQPRSVSRFGDENARVMSAKMLATVLFLQRGTPFIYQGQELGMTNAHFESLEQYKDIETHNVYKLGRETLKFSHKRMMHKIKTMSRDNARTPMQWSDSVNAGFTEGSPWIAVNPNHKTIHVDEQIHDPDSVLAYYKALIALRKQEPAFIDGQYQLYYKKHKQLYVYTRRDEKTMFLIVANFSEKKATFKMPQALKDYTFETVLSNVKDPATQTVIPYETSIYKTTL